MIDHSTNENLSLPGEEMQPRVRRRGRVVRWVGLIAISLGALASAGYFLTRQAYRVEGADLSPPLPTSREGNSKVVVQTMHPKQGGIQRICVQPGSIEPFESADLYAKVSGFLLEQQVDIGSRVKRGEVLAKIHIPEAEKQVQRDAATLSRAKAHVKQIAALVTASEAEARSARSMIDLADAEIQSKTASRVFRKKQFDRMKQLSEQRAVDDRLVDEKEDQYEAAVGAENAAKVNVTASRLKAEAVQAKIVQSQADLEEAKAQVEIAEADLARSQVLLEYAEIRSPYDGVITRRSFNRGDFIRSADAGGERVPLLTVERTDKMRVVVLVPDRDVPYVQVGDAATVETDALPGRVIKTTVARSAESEDTTTRTMRTEIDVPNGDGRLRRGMYGSVTLILEAGNPKSLTIPSAALSGKMVRVVRDGVIRNLTVVPGADNGVEVEILSGLYQSDWIVLRSSSATEEGTPVVVAGDSTSGH